MKPIAFTVDMVRAILSGQKTETRRPTPQTWAAGDILYVRESARVIAVLEDDFGRFIKIRYAVRNCDKKYWEF